MSAKKKCPQKKVWAVTFLNDRDWIVLVFISGRQIESHEIIKLKQ